MRITLAAFNDIEQARDWYEQQCSRTGNDFIQKVDETLSLIEHNPLIYPKLIDEARRANMKRFPYGIWFKVEGEPIVIACLHHRRNPVLMKDRTL